MRTFILCLSMLYTCLSLQAQQMTWSNEQKFKGRNNKTHIIGRSASAFYLMRRHSGLFTSTTQIEKYRANMSLEWSKNLDIADEFVKLCLLGDRICIFTSVSEREKGSVSLYVTVYDENLVKQGKAIRVDQANTRSYYDKSDFDIDISDNRTRILCYHSERSAEKKYVAAFVVLDTAFTRLSEKKVELPFRYDDFKLIDFTVNNRGDVAFNTVYYDQEKDREDALYARHLLFVHNHENNELTDYALNTKSGQYIYDVMLLNDELNRGFSLAGFYSKTDYESIHGVFQLSVNAGKQKISARYFSPFTQEYLAKIIGEKAASRKNASISNFELRKIIARSDGGIQIVAEKYYVTTQTQTYYFQGIPQATSRSFYNYDEILVMSLDPEGEYTWNTIINKSQSSVNDGGYYSSFVLGIEKDGLHIIYNDRLRNNGDVIQYHVSNTGKLQFSILMKSQTYYVAIIPSESRQVDNRTLIIPSNKDRRFSLLKLSY